MSAAMQFTEENLITEAQRSIDSLRWELGRVASAWLKSFSRGRRVSELGNFFGPVGYHPEVLMEVWDTFHECAHLFPNLRWGHYHAALRWPEREQDADLECGRWACLRWANQTQSTVAEMRAWRRAVMGEDLTVEEHD